MNKREKKKVVGSGNLNIFAGSKAIRSVVFYKNYFIDFYSSQRPKTRSKIDWTLKLIEDLPYIPETFLRHIQGSEGLYEIRVQHAGNIFRLFCFFDTNKLIIVVNAFQKKTQKTPISEIAKAMKIKKEYFNEKKC